ncbi:hypothetical protein [Variovorax boronicumulans]|uniref:hypothetical protein n=1 Tax=Variovorax boronicumulans TaxID=436515 RepID=UPI0012E63E33|nr:hypothetical protein [Variovorax boronicumulans]GER16684.1 hypothetical protein VCH24_16900 [Variovorax boronicumulans]
MVTVNKKYLSTSSRFGGAPYGNAVLHRFSLSALANGVLVDSDKATPPAIGDVVRIGILSAGLLLVDGKGIVSAAFTALATAKVGFQYVDGIDSATVPQDDDYFHAALALNAQGRTEANNVAVAPVVLPKDAYLILTWAGAANAAAGALDYVVSGVETGQP